MGNCNLDCCKCIDKKETQINNLSSHSNNKFKNNKYKLNQIRPIEVSQLLVLQNNTKDNINDEKNSIYTLENEKNILKEKYNNNTHSDTNHRDISLKYSKKGKKERFFSPNYRYDNIFNILKSKTKEKEKEKDKNIKNNKYKDKENKENKDNNYLCKEEDVEINDSKSPNIVPRFFHTNYKRSKITMYSKYFENINESKKELDMTGRNKNTTNKISNIFPIKYNYSKDKYITYFTDENI